MTWTKLSDDFPDECESLSIGARWLHLEGLVWSNRKLLDSVIPKAHLRKFASEPQHVAELVDHGYWTDDGDVYVIRHHAMYQRTKASVMKAQETSRKNGTRGGRPKAGARGTDLPGTQTGTQKGTQMGSDVGSESPRHLDPVDDSPACEEPSQVTQPLTQGVRSGQGSEGEPSTSTSHEVEVDPWADVVVRQPGSGKAPISDWALDMYDRER